MKLLEENIAVHADLLISFLISPQARTAKAKMSKWDNNKTKELLHSEENY